MNSTQPTPGLTVDLLSTEHLGTFLTVLALGALLGGAAVFALLHWLTTGSDTDDVEPVTVRMPPLSLIHI